MALFPPTGAPSSEIRSWHLTLPGPPACVPLSTTTFVAPSTITCKHVLTSVSARSLRNFASSIEQQMTGSRREPLTLAATSMIFEASC
ncbi:MAG: hypothetical protein ACK56I_34295, partial [bacterium]